EQQPSKLWVAGSNPAGRATQRACPPSFEYFREGAEETLNAVSKEFPLAATIFRKAAASKLLFLIIYNFNLSVPNR
ncbi:hypothetical protein, partial [Gluconobacter japonicus]|uniref:hypothetical protein n=1 Tax=Gluconobacter japonicus TaxID=376620 RepID=UPI0039EC3D83